MVVRMRTRLYLAPFVLAILLALGGLVVRSAAAGLGTLATASSRAGSRPVRNLRARSRSTASARPGGLYSPALRSGQAKRKEGVGCPITSS